MNKPHPLTLLIAEVAGEEVARLGVVELDQLALLVSERIVEKYGMSPGSRAILYRCIIEGGFLEG